MTNSTTPTSRNEATFETTGANGWTTSYEVHEVADGFRVTTEDHEDGVDFHTSAQTWSRAELEAWVAQLQRVLATSA